MATTAHTSTSSSVLRMTNRGPSAINAGRLASMSMHKSVSQGSPPLSADLLASVISYLDDYTEFHGSLWLEMGYAEKALGDISPFRDDLQHDLDHPWSPVFREGGLDADELKNIAVQLRQKIRADAGLPALTATETECWKFEMPVFRKRQSKYILGQQITEDIELDQDTIAEISSYVRREYPDIVRYWQGAPEENRRRGLQSGQEILAHYIWAPISEALDIFVPLEPHQSIHYRSTHAIVNALAK